MIKSHWLLIKFQKIDKKGKNKKNDYLIFDDLKIKDKNVSVNIKMQLKALKQKQKFQHQKNQE